MKRYLKKLSLIALALTFIVGLCPVKPLQAEAAADRTFMYLGRDQETGSEWNGKYGSEGYVLLGYDYFKTHLLPDGSYDLTEILARPYMPINQYDVIGGDVIKSFSTKNKEGLNRLSGDVIGGNTFIAMPPERSDEARFEACAISFVDPQSNHPTNPAYCSFDFNLNDDETRVFSVFSHLFTQSGPYIYEFSDLKTGEILYEEIFYDSDPARGGSYASFLVTGSFRLTIRTNARASICSAFFFDSLEDDQTTIDAKLNVKNNSVDLTITDEDTAPVNSYYITRADDNNAIKCISQLNPETKVINDTDTVGDTEYTYSVIKRGQKGFTKGDDVVFTTKKTTPLEITLSPLEKEIYEAGETVYLKAKVQAGSISVKNANVKFMLDCDLVTSQKIDPLIAEVTTNESGVATFEYPAHVAGGFGIYALVEQNYEKGFDRSKSNVVNLNVKLKTYTDVPWILKISDAIKYDELIAVNGEGFTGDLQIKAAPFAGEGNVPDVPPEDAIDLEIVQTDVLNGQYMMTKLPADAPTGLYSIWIKNDYGWSDPYTLNEARVSFISEYEVRHGMSIQISGRNLDLRQLNHEEHKTSVRLNDGCGNTYIQEIVRLTPYSATFKVNDSTPVGTYDVELTNNGGLSWVPIENTYTGNMRKQTLTVLEACDDPLELGVAWAGDFNWDAKYNVLDYGANNNDNNDDYDAIQTAIKTAHDNGGGVVYLPNGTYYFTKRLLMYPGVVLLGESKEETILWSAVPSGYFMESARDGEIIGLHGLANMTIKEAENCYSTGIWAGDDWSASYDQKLRKASRIFFKNINVEQHLRRTDELAREKLPNGQLIVVMNERILVKDSNFQNGGGFPCSYVNQYAAYDNSHWYFSNGYVMSAALFSFVTNCSCTGTPDPYITTGEPPQHGFFGRAYMHWENNSIKDLGFYGDSECFCVETPNSQFGMGNVLSATETRINTYPTGPYVGDSMRPGEPLTLRNSYLAVLITNGRGVGQLRAIKDYDPKGNWFEVYEPWDVIPDTSSSFAFVAPNDRVTIYGADIHNGGTAGSFYGNGYDNVADDIYGENCAGINAHNTSILSTNRYSFGYFLVYKNIETRGSMPAVFERHARETGARIANYRDEASYKFHGIVGIAQEFRNVKFIADEGGKFYAPRGALSFATMVPEDDKKGDMTCTIVEDCHFANAPYGLSIQSNVANGIIVRNPSFENISIKGINVPEGTVSYDLIETGPKTEGTTIEYDYNVEGSVTTGFDDLDGFEWAQDEILEALKRKLTNGTGKNIFSPAKSVTRAEFFTFVVRALGLDTIEYKNILSDVSADAWYADYIQTAYTKALIDDSMISGGKINPNQPITREEIAAVLARAIMNKEHNLNLTAENAGFKDMNEISSKYVNYVNIAKKYGITNGDDTNSFNPKTNANRAEAVVMLNRFYELVNEEA